MFTLIQKIYRSSPQQWMNFVAHKLRLLHHPDLDPNKIKALRQDTLQRFGHYKSHNLVGISPQEFRSYIESKIGMIDALSEGYSESEVHRQRDFSMKFHWGHNHDFGDFYLPGEQGDRHIDLLANFCSLFPVSLEDFRERDVFDIGCWTGGTSLVLAALGSRVFAIEEVKKYAEMASFLAKSFGIEDMMEVMPYSIFSCNKEDLYNRFDIIYFPGVLYHLSDPLIALRILYNCCKVGGMILIESEGLNSEGPFCRFDGSYIYSMGQERRLNRGGWQWFIPSRSALYRMLKEAGFNDIRTFFIPGIRRVYGYAKKTSQVAICKAGLSVPDIA